MERAVLSSQIAMAWGESMLSQFGKKPAVAGIPEHSAEFIFPGNPFSHERKQQEFWRHLSDFHFPLVPGGNAPAAESLLFEIAAVDRLRRKALPLDSESSFSAAGGGLFQKGPGAQNPVLDDPQVEVQPAGFMLMDYKFR